MQTPGSRYTFGPYTLHAGSRRLFQGRALVPVNGKALELLLLLVRSGGAALSREAIYQQLWPEGDVEDGNLTQNVYLLRRALDPHGDGRGYIETQPRFGYRFCAPVSQPQPAGWRIPVAAALALALMFALRGSSVALKSMPLGASAAEAQALGIYHLHLRTVPELRYARSYFEQTVHLAPQQPSGYAGLAATDALLAEFYPDRSRQQQHAIASARQFDEHALALDARDSDALAVAGFISFRFDQNPDRAHQYLSAALSSNPDNAAAHQWFGVLQLVEGDTRGAVANLESAHRIDPASEIFARWLARSYAYAGRPDDALRMATDALRIEPNDPASMLVRACAQEQRRDLRAAQQTLLALAARAPWERRFVEPDVARLQVLLHPDLRGALIARIDNGVAHNTVDRFEAALFYATAGMHRRALALMQDPNATLVTKGIQAHDPRTVVMLSLSTTPQDAASARDAMDGAKNERHP